MSTMSVRGLVIKEKTMGESNKQLTVLAKDFGKITVSARGAKNLKSKFHSTAQLFCYGDFMLYDGKNFLAVTEASLIMNFSAYYNEIHQLAYGMYFLELIDKTVMYEQESNDILLLLLKSLQQLKGVQSHKKISSVFQVKLLDLLGFRLTPSICVICEAKTNDIFYLSSEGFVCNCVKNKEFTVSHNVKRAIDYISEMGNGYDKIFMFIATDSVINELHFICENTFSKQLGIETNSLALLI